MQKTHKVRMGLMALGAGVLACGGVVMSQAVGAAKERFEARSHVAKVVQRAQQELGLTETQKGQVKTILQEAVPRMINVHDDHSLAPEVRREKVQAMREQTKQRISAILTPAQREKAEDWRTNLKSRVQQTCERVADELELSKAQREKIKPLVEGGFAQAKAVREDMSLTVAQKFVKFHQIRRETRAKVDAELTAKQRTELDAIRHEILDEGRRQFGLWREKNPG